MHVLEIKCNEIDFHGDNAECVFDPDLNKYMHTCEYHGTMLDLKWVLVLMHV